MSYPNKDPKELFGEDLIKVFGPKADRKHISKFSREEIEAILNKIPDYVDTDDLGLRPSFFQIVNKILSILSQNKALYGIDLDWCSSLEQGKIKRHKSHYINTSIAYKNGLVQRGIQLRHLFRDIVFQFTPDHVLMGLARKLSDGTVNLNNGQHRTVGCIILGIREIPVEWIDSDQESVDVDEYATDNLHTLSASAYDEFRIKVRRNQIRKKEGRSDLIAEDIKCEDMFDIHYRYGSRFVEKSITDKPIAKECSGVGNMEKYYDIYGSSLYERAISIVCSVFAKAQLATANAWAVMEFLREQENNGPAIAKEDIDWAVQTALTRIYNDQRKYGMYKDIKKAFSNFVLTDTNGGAFSGCPEQRYLAAGIEKLCRKSDPTIKWATIRWNGKKIVDCLNDYKVM